MSLGEIKMKKKIIELAEKKRERKKKLVEAAECPLEEMRAGAQNGAWGMSVGPIGGRNGSGPWK